MFDLRTHLESRLTGFTALGVTTLGGSGFHRILAEELIAAGITESQLADALRTLKNVPEPQIVAMHSVYRDVKHRPTVLSTLTYEQLQNIRASVLRVALLGAGGSMQAMLDCCVGGAKSLGFKPTLAQVRIVVQTYVSMGVIRLVKPGARGGYAIV